MKCLLAKASATLTISSALLLTACGGGGGSTGSSTPPPTFAASTVSSTNAQEVSAHGFAASDSLNSQINSSSGLVTGVSTDTATNGLLDLSLRQLYRALELQSSANMVVGVTTSETVQCTNGGTAVVMLNIASTTKISAGDKLTVIATNCQEGTAKMNGGMNITFNSVVGIPSATSVWSGSLGMVFTDFSVTTPTGAPIINGDMSLSLNQSGFQNATYTVSGNSLKMSETKNGATSERTVTAIDGTNVSIGLDKNGDGVIDETTATTWVALMARI